MMGMPAWSARVDLTLAWAALSSYTDEDNCSPPAETHDARPSSEAIARKAMELADSKLSHDVRKAIAEDGDVEMSNVAVIARSGKVTLLGSVPGDGQIGFAVKRAQAVAGVTDVVSHFERRRTGRTLGAMLTGALPARRLAGGRGGA
jgi:hyperosmotically inducible protein